MKKILFIVIDGLADEGKTPLMNARKPNLDFLSLKGRNGYFFNKLGKHPDSPLSNLYLLGYKEKDFPGRGYLAALSVMKPRKTDICFRCNFATLRQGLVVDMRAGREELGLNVLAKTLNKIDKRIIFRHILGHRAVLVLRGGFSEKVALNAPFGGKTPVKIKPLNKSKTAIETAILLKKFVKESHELLSKHPLNRKRKHIANYILLRNTGKFRDVESFKKRHGLKGGVVAAAPDIIGIGKYLKMKTVEVGNGHVTTDLKAKVRATKRLLKTCDLVFLHIKGCDEAGHDGDCKGKRRFLERIDKQVLSQVRRLDVTTIVTADHVTACRAKDYAHHKGLVPVLIYSKGKGDRVSGFDEKSVLNGALGQVKQENLIRLASK